MAYVPTVWENDTTEVDEDNMNHIEQGIKDNDDKLQGITSMGSIVVDSIRSKNMFNKDTVQRNKFIPNDSTSETLSDYTDTYTTDWIPCKPSTTYVISGTQVNKKRCQFKNAGGIITYGEATGSNVPYTINTPNDAVYFRTYFCAEIANATFTDVQIEEGSTATPYAPYQNLDSIDEINAVAEDLLAYVSGTKPMGNIRCNKLSGEISNLPNPVVGGQPSKNLNDFVGQGTFNFDNGDNSYSNAPTTDGIHVLVITNNGSYDWVVQEDYVLRWGTNPPVKYIRGKTPAGWSNWQSTT